MNGSISVFQQISLRRRVSMTIGILSLLVIVSGVYGIVALGEFNQRLHKSVREGHQMAEAIDTARLAQVHFKRQVQEWKNILLRGNDRRLFDQYLKAFSEEDQKVAAYLQALSRLTADNGIPIPRVGAAITAHDELGKRYRETLTGRTRLDLADALRIDLRLRGIDRNLTDEIDAIVETIKSLTQKKLTETETIAQTQMKAYYALSFFLMLLIVAGVCFGSYNAWAIIRDLPPESGNPEKP